MKRSILLTGTLVLILLSHENFSGTRSTVQGQADLDAAVRQVHQSQCRDGLEALGAIASAADLEAARASFLMGWCLVRLGRASDAAAAFRAAASHPTLAAHARVEEAVARLNSGDAEVAVAALREIPPGAPRALRRRALGAVGEAELVLGRADRALLALTAAAEARPDDPSAWLRLGAAAVDAGQRVLARQALARAGWAFPGETAEGVARAAFARAFGRPMAPADAPPEARLERGRRLQRDGETAPAEIEFRSVVAARASGPTAAEAWYRLGELRLRSNARAAFEAFRRAAVLGWDLPRTYYWTAVAARRAGRGADAAAAVTALTRVAPSGPWLAQTWLARGLRAEDDGRRADAAVFYRRAVTSGPRSHEAAEARWRLGWIALRGGRLADAEVRFREAGDAAPSRGEAARGWYWAAKVMEARRADPTPLLRLVVDRFPLTYYGQRASARLNVPAPQLLPTLRRHAPPGAPGPAFEELARLGLDADAVASAEDALAPDDPRAGLAAFDPAGRAPRPRDFRAVRFLADVYGKRSAVRESVALADDALANGVRDEAMWRLAYPRAFWSEVTAAANAAGIDPLLLLALVREESRYDPSVISPARAVGLAQLLPSTAQELARDASITVQSLKDPGTNLRLGARYLRLQLDRFDGDVRLALAAYNAGPGAARRWVGLDPDPDYFVERVGYTETRAYIRRVLGSYGIYRLLWEGR
ncbi:MAG: transglycosylase SLT domain-containing protein [Armatimonadota bacterium]